MTELATLVAIQNQNGAPLPEELLDALRENGWRPVRKNAVYALPWQTALGSNGGEALQLLQAVEEVRRVLTRLRIRHRFETMDNVLRAPAPATA